MTRLSWLSCAAAFFVASCGGSHARECTFNSDCPTGRYCTAAGACTADCTTDNECITMLGAGAACSSFGMCVAPADAGGPMDAGSGMDAGVRMDAGASDAGPGDAGSDAGPPAEVCTPSTAGSVPTDENGDGVIDEGCPWAFGVAHPVAGVTTIAGNFFHPRPSADGLALYMGTTALGSGTYYPVVARRASTAEPFEAAEPVVGAFTGVNISVFTPTDDLLEAIVQVQAPGSVTVARTQRASVDAPFGAPTTLFGGAQLQHPALAADALTLYVENVGVMPPRIFRATRPTRAADFGTLERVMIPDLGPAPEEEHSPWVIDGGAGLLFVRVVASAARVYMTRRGPTGAFAEPVELAALEDSTGFTMGMSYSPRTREIFFTSSRDWAPSRPGSLVAWRAEVCRDGACPDRLVECPAGRRSPDGLHCYFPGPAALGTYDEARLGCATRGGHLPTVTSEAERAFLWLHWGGAAPAWLWLGGTDAGHEGTWRWDWSERVTPEEPWVFDAWGLGQPDGSTAQNYVNLNAVLGGLFGDVYPEVSTAYVCEDELWPTW